MQIGDLLRFKFHKCALSGQYMHNENMGIIFAVHESIVKTAKIGHLDYFPLYVVSLILLEWSTLCTPYSWEELNLVVGSQIASAAISILPNCQIGTVNHKIFVVKIFSDSMGNMKIKHMKKYVLC